MIQGETLGRSFYEWDAEVPGGIEKRVLGYWRTLGYQYKTPGDEVRTKTIEERADMLHGQQKVRSLEMAIL